MRKAWGVAGVAIVVAIAAWLLPAGTPSEVAPSNPVIAAPVAAAKSEDARATVAPPATPEIRITGVVVGDHGKPLADARVFADDAADVTATTGDDGAFTLAPLTPGPHLVEVFHRDHLTFGRTLDAPKFDTTIRLEAGLSIIGVVVDGANRPVVAEVRVMGANTLGEAEVRDYARVRIGSSDAQGRFRIRGLTEGKHLVDAEAEDGESEPHPIDVSAGSQQPLRLVVSRGTTITGVVVDSKGSPVSEATVTATMRSRIRALAHAESTGAFTLRRLERNTPYEVALSTPADSPKVTAKAGDRNVKLVWNRPRVRGRVVQNGQPVTECQVNGADVVEGTFAFDLEAGPLKKTLRFVCPGLLPLSKEITSAGEDVDLGDIELSGRVVRFRVVEAITNKPIDGAEVRFEGDSADDIVLTSDAGIATLSGLPTAESSVVVSHPAHPPATVPIADSEKEVTVRLDTQAALVVTVTTPGQALMVKILAIEEATGRSILEFTNETGSARLEPIAPGRWVVQALKLLPNGDALRAQRAVDVPLQGVLPVTMELKAGRVSACLRLGFDAAKTTVVVVFPPGIRAPANGTELFHLFRTGVNAELQPDGCFKVEGLEAGPHQVAMIRSKDGGSEMFVTALELSEANQQTFTIAEGRWTNATRR